MSHLEYTVWAETWMLVFAGRNVSFRMARNSPQVQSKRIQYGFIHILYTNDVTRSARPGVGARSVISRATAAAAMGPWPSTEGPRRGGRRRRGGISYTHEYKSKPHKAYKTKSQQTRQKLGTFSTKPQLKGIKQRPRINVCP